MRFFIWLSLGPQWTYSKRFWSLTNFLQKNPNIYSYIWRKTLKEKYLQLEDFRDFLFGCYWDPNKHIPTGFALMVIISQKKFCCLQYKKMFFGMHTLINSRYNFLSLTLPLKVIGGHWRSLEVKKVNHKWG